MRNNYANKIVPILLEHNIITEDEREVFEDYISRNHEET